MGLAIDNLRVGLMRLLLENCGQQVDSMSLLPAPVVRVSTWIEPPPKDKPLRPLSTLLMRSGTTPALSASASFASSSNGGNISRTRAQTIQSSPILPRKFTTPPRTTPKRGGLARRLTSALSSMALKSSTGSGSGSASVVFDDEMRKISGSYFAVNDRFDCVTSSYSSRLRSERKKYVTDDGKMCIPEPVNGGAIVFGARRIVFRPFRVILCFSMEIWSV